ncbi:MAG: Hsp33 family molecular chaperone HslO [Spirochaetaceae bacterium]|nr:Hsp33 family molecular chaperone HslO [Spirochaetaceae bacterium]
MIKTKINDEKLLKHLKTIVPDEKNIFLLENNKIRATILGTTEMVNQVRANYKLNMVEAITLGEAYIANALLASTVKGNDRVQLSIECGGPCGGVYTEAWASGAVRGYLKNNFFGLKQSFPVDTDPIYGPGFLTVSKILEGSKSPFKGQIMLQHGNLSKDLRNYFLKSEQTKSLFIIDFDVDEENRIIGAGGIFFQLLPDNENDGFFEEFEKKVNKLPSLAKAISSGMDPKDFIIQNFDEIKFLSHSLVGFSCPCDKRTFANHLQALPSQDKKDIKKNGPFPLELVCLNCNSNYEFGKAELDDLLK